MIPPPEKFKSLKTFQNVYNSLNVRQKEAVDTIDGPVLVIAGPGTGKTQVLTTRIANILLKTDVPSSSILALTFTDSGVKAMRDRLLGLIGPQSYYVNVYTFHSFCSDIIRDNADKFVTPVDLEPLSQLERVQIFREILREEDFEIIKPFGSRYFYIRSLIKNIQDLKREGVNPNDLEKALEKIRERESKAKVLKGGRKDLEDFEEIDLRKNKELIRVYQRYQEKLKEKSRYDFEDMINLVVEAFSREEPFLRRYQEKFQYILLDEFQDTNTPQNKVVSLLASYWGEEANIFAVGDDEQAIYRFQGASLENILYFKNLYPKAKVVTLRDNYRSNQRILDGAYSVIQRNEIRLSNYITGIERKLTAKKGDGERVKIGHFGSSITESFFVASKIKDLLLKGVNPSAIAVIYRNNADSAIFTDMLSRMGISYSLQGGEDILKDPDLGKILRLFSAILKIRKKEEDIDLFTLFNYDFLLNKFGFIYLDTLKLARFSSDLKVNFFEAIIHKDFGKGGIVSNPKSIKNFVDKLIEWGRLSENLSFSSLFERVVDESGYLSWVLNPPQSIEKLNRLNSLFSQVKRLNLADPQLSIERFFEDIAVLKESGIPLIEEDLDIKADAVTLTTAHGAKGLEFDYVFIVTCIDGKFGNNKVRELIKLPPNILEIVESKVDVKIGRKEQNEDERRLFYVSLTRARKEVFISHADYNLVNGVIKEVLPSMFIEEIGDENKDKVDTVFYERGVKSVLNQILKPVIDLKPTIEEKEFLRTVLVDFRLSVTALNTYLECPYKFKINNLFRTPRAKDKYLCFGSAVHKALENFFRLYLSGDRLPSPQILIDSFETALKGEILTPEDFSEVLRKGRKILRAYFDFYKSSMTRPLFIEKFLGYGFSRIYLDDIPLTGKIDKVELLSTEGAGGKSLVKVVDYKTGKTRSRNEIEGRTKNADLSYKRQLTFYKLLADLDPSFNFEVEEVELDFVEGQRGEFFRHSFRITGEEVDELKTLIKDVVGRIRKLEFPKTTDNRFCSMCEFASHCWSDGVPPNIDQLTLLQTEPRKI